MINICKDICPCRICDVEPEECELAKAYASHINKYREVISEMDAVKNDVICLVFKELKSANEKFPPFNSDHEGYAVIKEEVEEAQECFNNINTAMKEI
ncbi:MAG: hypothetical protein K0S76_449 [Herbinix sp.]|jgi:hypothetical protein|nr:hypothetical protein [Herbinix sp.]